MVLPNSHRVSRAPWYSGAGPGVLVVSPTGLSPSAVELSSSPRLPREFLTPRAPCNAPMAGPITPPEQRLQSVTSWKFGLFPVRSPLLGESLLISVPPATEMFHFTGLPARPYEFRPRSDALLHRWFPHSGSSGSMPACGYPEIIAARCALRRHLPPGHPPCALLNLQLIPLGESCKMFTHLLDY